jgi:hypothetical protein
MKKKRGEVQTPHPANSDQHFDSEQLDLSDKRCKSCGDYLSVENDEQNEKFCDDCRSRGHDVSCIVSQTQDVKPQRRSRRTKCKKVKPW